jgi:heat shock protein HslJ
MRSILLTAISAFLLLTACNSGKHSTVTSKKVMANPSELNGIWQLNYISGTRAAFDSLYPGEKPRIAFDVADSSVSGHTGCNRFSGPVNITGSKIGFHQSFTMTKMFCPGKGEMVFLEALRKTNSWAVTDASTLNLIMDDTAIMRFTKTN